MKVRAYGKLNLSLTITGRRGGLHTLDGVMHSVGICDELTVTENDVIGVTVNGADIPEEKNTAFAAAALVRERFGLVLRAEIVKRIPVGGGMGGSSADAAGVLAAAARMLGDRALPGLLTIAAEIGSDVPFMLRGGCARVRGTGNELTALPFVPFTALVADCGAVSTPQCYGLYDTLPEENAPDPEDAVADVMQGRFPRTPYNALGRPAAVLNPLVGECVRAADEAGYTAVVTGSGGCVYVPDASVGAERVFEKLGVPYFRVDSVRAGTDVTV